MVNDAFGDFVAARGPALWRAAWLLTGDRDLAEDLVQTALVKAWPKFGQISAAGSFEAYVRRTIFNTYLSWRGRKWSGEVPGRIPEHENPPGRDVDLTLDLQRALALLTPRQRAVVALRYFEDLTEGETARALGCSLGSVKTHHARALVALREAGLIESKQAAEELS